jgi:hypothetical protein
MVLFNEKIIEELVQNSQMGVEIRLVEQNSTLVILGSHDTCDFKTKFY